MRRFSPKNVIIPTVFFVSSLLLTISRSVFDLQTQRNKSVLEDIPKKSEAELSSSFPPPIQQWNDYILQAAEKNNLDPDLIATIILQESGGQPNIISSSGAVGLMQVMPRDGKASSFLCINGPCFQNRPQISDLKNPGFNINYGSNLLANLIESKGSIRSALHAYGPMDVGYSYADTILALYRSNQRN